MIEIYVNRERLDIQNEDVSFHFTNMLFSGKIVDEFSNDFEIPRTAKNEKILNPSASLYRGQLFSELIDCLIVTNSYTFDGGIQIVAVTKSTIKIAVFATFVSEEVLNKKVKEIIHDDDTTIFDFPTSNSIAGSLANVDAGLIRFNMTAKPRNTSYGLPSFYLPSIRVNKVLSMLSDATPYTFPAIDENYFMTATNRKFCPYDMHQYIFIGGKTPNSVIDGGTAFATSETVEAKKTGVIDVAIGSELTFNHDGKMDVEIEVFGEKTLSSAGGEARIIFIYPNGNEREVAKVAPSTGSTFKKVTVANIDVVNGYKLRFENVKAKGSAIYDGKCAFYITYTRITNQNSGEFNNEDMPQNLGFTPIINPFEVHDFNRIGTIYNLNNLTIRELLTSLAWQLGKTIKFVNGVFSFVSQPTEKNIDAIIDEWSPSSNALGQLTSVNDAEDVPIFSKSFASDFLKDKMVLFKSSFFYSKPQLGNDYATIPIYEADDKGEYSLKEIKGIPLSYAKDIDGWKLTPIDVIGNVSSIFDKISKVLEVTGRTMQDVSQVMKVRIDGILYLIIEGDRDEKSGMVEFTALQMNG